MQSVAVFQMLTEVFDPDIAGSLVDHGLAPGAGLRLVRTQRVHLRGPERYDTVLARSAEFVVCFVV